MTLHLPSGDLAVVAENNSKENVYIQSMTIDGTPYNSCFITHDTLLRAREIKFVMGSTPSSFGADSAPRSLSKENTLPCPMSDLLSSATVTANENVDALTDNSTLTEQTFTSGTVQITANLLAPHTVSILTIACGKSPELAPETVKLEAKQNGTWVEVDTRTAVKNQFENEIKPFALQTPITADSFHITLTRANGGALCLSEIELIGK